MCKTSPSHLLPSSLAQDNQHYQFCVYLYIAILYTGKYVHLFSHFIFSHKKMTYTTYLGASQVALVVKNSPANAGDARNVGLMPGSWRSPAGGNGNQLQYSCLENPMDRRAWQAIVHRLTESQTWQHTHIAWHDETGACVPNLWAKLDKFSWLWLLTQDGHTGLLTGSLAACLPSSRH